MSIVSTYTPTQNIRTNSVAMTPYELYLSRVKDVTENLRSTNQGLAYYPMQVGGLKGQRQALAARAVLDVISFNIKS